MIDFFMFSTAEVLTSLRLLFVAVWVVSILTLTVVFTENTIRAFSYGRVLRGVVGKVVPADYWRFVKHCYRHTSRSVTTRWSDGSFWKGIGDWAYIDKKTGKWVQSKKSGATGGKGADR